MGAATNATNYYPLTLTVNGEKHNLLIPPSRTLLELLREDLGLTGAKHGCGDSNCGACTVILDGQAVKSCCLLALQADGAEVLTIEGLEGAGGLHPLQQAFVDHFALQCGFCTPGMILTAKAILDGNPGATEDDIREGLHGNVCRCTGYKKIVEAVVAVQRGDYAEGGRTDEA
ncbi:MAG: (2Fe-2S)-binding protein [Clostridiales bacterium]|nr:(2Fe-2S)-binding protein [Clostridiales bacterium]